MSIYSNTLQPKDETYLNINTLLNITCPVFEATLNASIPHCGLTAIFGPSGVGKSTLAVDVLYRESRRRMVERQEKPIKNKRIGGNTLGARPSRLWTGSIEGLLPAVLLMPDKAGIATGQLGDALGIRKLLENLLSRVGVRSCMQCKEPLTSALPEKIAADVAAQISGGLKQNSEACGRLVVGAYFSQSLIELLRVPETAKKSQPETLLYTATRIVENLRYAGYRRFILANKLYRLPPLSVKQLKENPFANTSSQEEKAEEVFFQEFEKLLNSSGKDRSFGVVVDTLDITSVDRCRIIESLDDALLLGSPVAFIQRKTFSDKKSKELPIENPEVHRWFVTDGYFCSSCGIPYPEFLETEFDKLSLNVSFCGKNLEDLLSLRMSELRELLKNTKSSSKSVASLREMLEAQLSQLIEIGLNYLCLSRQLSTLSSGELLKLNISRFLNAGLVETLFIVDEPGSVLHPDDLRLFYKACRALVAQGNAVLVVERNYEFATLADWILELGWNESREKGVLSYVGPARDWPTEARSCSRAVDKPKNGSEMQTQTATLKVQVKEGHFPVFSGSELEISLNAVVAVTGVSGAGKTILLRDVIPDFVAAAKQNSVLAKSSGASELRKVEYLDVNKRRSQCRRDETIASFVGFSQDIAEFFADLPTARRFGFSASEFLLDKPGGRCKNCEGTGLQTIELGFAEADVSMCDVCLGKRFELQILKVEALGKSIYQVLELDVKNALSFFAAKPRIVKLLSALYDLGLGAFSLGQPVVVLSRSVFSRLCLARLVTVSEPRGRMELLDNPFYGLERDEVELAVNTLRKYCRAGGSLVFSTHDEYAAALAENVICLEQNDFLTGFVPWEFYTKY